jgi:hypothetical protein
MRGITPHNLFEPRKAFSEKRNLFLFSLMVLSFASVISLSALGVTRMIVYVSELIFVYFATSLIFDIRRRTFDFLSLGLLIVFAICILSIFVYGLPQI